MSGSEVEELVEGKRVLVLCGAGGVGKTTTSAALALAGARAGKRVLVLTIDPARRLAQALGIPDHAEEPTPVPAERLQAAGVDGSGTLDAWMLDPRVVFEGLVRKLSSPDKAEVILDSRLYRHLTDLIAGMQEYTAAEALYSFAHEGRYDLIVLDTPPSRSALDFLEAPGRLGRFLEDGVVQLFLPKEGGLLRRAGRFLSQIFARVFGESFVEELQVFLSAFSGMFTALRAHTRGVRELLQSKDAAFLLVTSTDEEAVDEALYFQEKLIERALPFAGFVLNRSYAALERCRHPEELPPLSTAEERAAMAKLGRLADRERSQAREDRRLLDKLKALAGRGFAVAAPHLGEAVEDLPGLLRLARGMAD